VSYPYYISILFSEPLGLKSEHQTEQARNFLGMIESLQRMGMLEANGPMPTTIRVGVKGPDDPSFEFAAYFVDALKKQFGGEEYCENIASDGSSFGGYNVTKINE
jgi:hypothetical protein